MYLHVNSYYFRLVFFFQNKLYRVNKSYYICHNIVTIYCLHVYIHVYYIIVSFLNERCRATASALFDSFYRHRLPFLYFSAYYYYSIEAYQQVVR